jgi:dihydrofolate reductase
MITIIAALTSEGIIGKQKSLPWSLPEDMAHFKRVTEGNTVIMGRKTWMSIPIKYRPLPNRHNIVVSRNMQQEENIDVCTNMNQAIAKAKSYGKDIFVIGGAQIYALAIEHATKMLLSHIHKDYEGDTFFPKFNKEEWNITNIEEYKEFTLHQYIRRSM